MRILLLTGPASNKGEMAIAMSAAESIKSLIPNATFTILSKAPELDRENYKETGIEIKASPIYKSAKSKIMRVLYFGIGSFLCLLSSFLWPLFKTFNPPVRGELQNYDLYIELGGDIRTEYYGDLGLLSLYNPFLLSGIILRKPFVIWAQTIGPFKNKLARFGNKFYLNKASLITTRDEDSQNYLQSMGIKKTIYLTADSAFLLKPVSTGRVSQILAEEGISGQQQRLVGISASQLIPHYAFVDFMGLRGRHEESATLIARLADYVAEKLNSMLIFIPHVIGTDNDDRLIHKEIYQKTRNKEKINLINGDYSAAELKGIIGKCQIFIGCRMHAVIASTSMYVPTIAISYSHKFQGVLGSLLDQGKYIIDITKSSPESFFNELCSKIDYIWENKEKITQELKEKIPEVRRKALLNAELVKSLLAELSAVEKSSK